MLALESITKAYNLLTDTYNVVELTCLNDLSRVPDFECFFHIPIKKLKITIVIFRKNMQR